MASPVRIFELNPTLCSSKEHPKGQRLSRTGHHVQQTLRVEFCVYKNLLSHRLTVTGIVMVENLPLNG